jgi:prenyl protein peptidase
VEPTIQSVQLFIADESCRWVKLRNLAIAPVAEEVIFRACLIPPLLASKSITDAPLSPSATAWIGPLFFGVAHLHHFYEQYRQIPTLQRSRNVVYQLFQGILVQLAYTTLFGAYVSHVFVRTASLSGVTLAHAVCNYMGLPEVGFVNPTSTLYCYRWIIWIMYLVGVWLFVAGFEVVFPTLSVLPSLLYPQR